MQFIHQKLPAVTKTYSELGKWFDS